MDTRGLAVDKRGLAVDKQGLAVDKLLVDLHMSENKLKKKHKKVTHDVNQSR